MRTVMLCLPETFEIEDREIKMILASKLYGNSELSLGQAATLAELSKLDFIQSLGKYDVSIFNYPPSDLARDIKNA